MPNRIFIESPWWLDLGGGESDWTCGGGGRGGQKG